MNRLSWRDYGTVTGKNLDLSPTFGWNLRFTLSLSSSPTSRKVFQSTKKYKPFFRRVGKTGFGALVEGPPKDSSNARRFVAAVVDDVCVTVFDKPEPSLAESEAVELTVVVIVCVVVVVIVVIVEVVVGEPSTDSATRSVVNRKYALSDTHAGVKTYSNK